MLPLRSPKKIHSDRIPELGLPRIGVKNEKRNFCFERNFIITGKKYLLLDSDRGIFNITYLEPLPELTDSIRVHSMPVAP